MVLPSMPISPMECHIPHQVIPALPITSSNLGSWPRVVLTPLKLSQDQKLGLRLETPATMLREVSQASALVNLGVETQGLASALVPHNVKFQLFEELKSRLGACSKASEMQIGDLFEASIRAIQEYDSGDLYSRSHDTINQVDSVQITEQQRRGNHII